MTVVCQDAQERERERGGRSGMEDVEQHLSNGYAGLQEVSARYMEAILTSRTSSQISFAVVKYVLEQEGDLVTFPDTLMTALSAVW